MGHALWCQINRYETIVAVADRWIIGALTDGARWLHRVCDSAVDIGKGSIL